MSEVYENSGATTLYARKEVTYGDAGDGLWEAGDAVRYREADMRENAPLVDPRERGIGRSRTRGRLGRRVANPVFLFNWRPGHDPGDKPEIDVFLENFFGMGAASTNPVAAWKYTMTSVQTASIAVAQVTDLAQEIGSGIGLSDMEVTIGGNDLTQFRFTGQGQFLKRFVPFTLATVSGTPAQSVGSGMVAFDYLDVGNVVEIGGAKYTVASVSRDDDTFELGSAPTASTNEAVTSGIPEVSYGEDLDTQPQFGTEGFFKFDDVDVEIIGGVVRANNGTRLDNVVYGTKGPRGVVSPSRRNIRFEIEVIAKASDMRRLSQIEREVVFEAELGLGDERDRHGVFMLPQVEFEPASPVRVLDEFSTITLVGQATATSADNEMVFEVR